MVPSQWVCVVHGWAGCLCVCGSLEPASGANIRTKSQTLMFGFTVSARELGKLHVQGNKAECKELLGSLGGVQGVATKLSTNVNRGVSGDQQDLTQRQEAYVPCARFSPALVAGGSVPVCLTNSVLGCSMLLVVVVPWWGLWPSRYSLPWRGGEEEEEQKLLRFQCFFFLLFFLCCQTRPLATVPSPPPLPPCLRYGKNVFPEPPFSGFWALFFESFEDTILQILILAAIVSFIIGLIEHPKGL